MAEPVAATYPAPAATPRKPSKLIADLAAAMRATAEVAREQSQSQVEAEAKDVVEQFRAQSSTARAALPALRRRHRRDPRLVVGGDRAHPQETDRRITNARRPSRRKIAAHGAAIERPRRAGRANRTAYKIEMAEFFERLLGETDPGRLATMAESMPEPPSLVEWVDLPDSALPDVPPRRPA